MQNLLGNGSEPVSINDISIGKIASSRGWLNEVLGFDGADLYQQEIDNLRPQVYNWVSKQMEEPTYHKIHDACWQVDSGEWLVSAKATAGAVYFIRNPLDVAISFANHNQSSIDRAIKVMSKSTYCLCKNEHRSLKDQTEQRLLSWSEHVTSWVDNPDISTHVVRYEDMKHQAVETFSLAVDYLQLDAPSCKITNAIQFSDFSKLQKQEELSGFNECPPKAKKFFRKGIVGDWQQTLTSRQIYQIIGDHHAVMQRFGYLDDEGNPQVM